MNTAKNIGRCHTCPHGNLHLSGADVPCAVDDVGQLVHARADWCPAGRFGSREKPAGLVVLYPPPAVTITKSFWPALRDLVDAGLTPANLAGLVDTLPDFRRVQWDELVEIHPPVFDGGALAWAIAIQNALHDSLGKPRLGPDGRPAPKPLDDCPAHLQPYGGTITLTPAVIIQ